MGKPKLKQFRADGVVMSPTSNPGRLHNIKYHLGNPKWRAISLGVFIFFVVVLSVVLLVVLRSPKPSETIIQNEATVISDEYKKLIDQGPPKTAVPEEVIGYYDSLATRAADTKRYDEAVKAYERRALISPKSMSYRDYFVGAKYYCKAGDKTKAREAIDKSISMFPSQDDYDAGFYRDRMMGEIEFLRKDCAL